MDTTPIPAPSPGGQTDSTRADILRIAAAAADVFGVDRFDLLSRVRRDDVVRARHATFVLCWWAGYTASAIARAIGLKDHTTVSRGIVSFWDRALLERQLKPLVFALADRLCIRHP